MISLHKKKQHKKNFLVGGFWLINSAAISGLHCQAAIGQPWLGALRRRQPLLLLHGRRLPLVAGVAVADGCRRRSISDHFCHGFLRLVRRPWLWLWRCLQPLLGLSLDLRLTLLGLFLLQEMRLELLHVGELDGFQEELLCAIFQAPEIFGQAVQSLAQTDCVEGRKQKSSSCPSPHSVSPLRDE